MKSILIVSGAQEFARAKGALNRTYSYRAKEFLSEHYNVHVTEVVNGYDIDAERQRILGAECIIYQFPLYWFAAPSNVKRYIEDIFAYGSFFEGASEYGTGGKLNGKYMLSVTGNAPKRAFNNPDAALLEGKNIDDLLLPFHKSQTYIGLEPLPTFAAYDVVMNSDFENDIIRFEEHLITHLRGEHSKTKAI